MIDHRASPRQRVLKRGLLAFSGSGIDCIVRNMSADGARLDVESPAQLPQSFTLVIETDQFMRRCRPVWCQDRKLGVAFE